jgi:hypothetical protein
LAALGEKPQDRVTAVFAGHCCPGTNVSQFFNTVDKPYCLDGRHTMNVATIGPAGRIHLPGWIDSADQRRYVVPGNS